jgi:hypothetical protein
MVQMLDKQITRATEDFKADMLSKLRMDSRGSTTPGKLDDLLYLIGYQHREK